MLFQRLCMVARNATQAAYENRLSYTDKHYVLSTAPRVVRVAFNDLVGADIDATDPNHIHQEHPISPHIPDSGVLHIYVRTLGVLRDYEGLYSLSIWVTTNHKEITASAQAQQRGLEPLYLMLVALRASLEGHLGPKHDTRYASPELVALVKERIESVEGWGWPSDKQVDEYVSKRSPLYTGVRHVAIESH